MTRRLCKSQISKCTAQGAKNAERIMQQANAKELVIGDAVRMTL